MPKQKPYSFRPDAPLQERVQKILDATGLTARDLLDRSALVVFDTATGTVYLLNTTTTNWTTIPKPK